MNLNKLFTSLFLIFFLLGINNTQAQPFGSGILGIVAISTSNTQVNQYSSVSSYVLSSGGYDIAVSNASYFSNSNKALLFQMTGANAGSWEWVSILQVNPGVVRVANIINTYTPGSGAVQLVFVPEYQDLTITTTGSIVPQTWNGTTGGVLSVLVAGTLTIQAGGTMNASGKGFQSGMSGVAGTGGLGGYGGTAPGGLGGSVGQVFNTGIGGGGDGGAKGAAGTVGTNSTIVSCPGCTIGATNVGNISSNILMMGGAGQSANAGSGHSGAGGGGGGANGSQLGANGTAGGNGGNGGNGGIGGNGGGVIIAAASNLSLPNQVCFLANGLAGASGQSATAGGPGGYGGIGGGGCSVGGGGGGGNGGDGGDGGNGGNGGAGGMIKIIRGATTTAPASMHKQVLGAAGGFGGYGGAGGAAGVNAGSANGMPCSSGTSVGGGGGSSISGGSCNSSITLNVLQNMGIAGTNTGIYTNLGNGFHFYTNGFDSVYVEEINPLTVIVHNVNYLGNTFTVVSGTGMSPSPLATIQQIFTLGTIVIPIAATGNLIGDSATYFSDCMPVRNEPSPGQPGVNGLLGIGAGDGDSDDEVVVDCSSNPVIVTVSTGLFYDCINSVAGQITPFAAGGSAPYTYTYNVAGNIQTYNGFPFNANDQTGELIAVDANGCADTINAVAEYAPVNPWGYINIVNVNCFGGNTGESSLSAFAGNNYPFANMLDIVDQNNQSVFSNWDNTTGIISGLSAGAYTIVQQGCGNFVDPQNMFTITEPSALALNPTVLQPTCSIAGSVSLAVSGGIAPYTYLWSNNQTSDNVTNLTGGVVSVTVNDGNGCTITDSFIINSASSLVATISSIASTCGQANGLATVMVTGAALPVTYLWSNSATSDSITNLSANTYSVIVTDANGCTALDSVVVSNNDTAPGFTVKITEAKCNGEQGSIEIYTNIGTTYSYLWSTGDTTSTIFALAGTYTVTITTAYGCSTTQTYTITQPSTPVSATTTVTQPNCSNPLGAINITVTGGTPGYQGYLYYWTSSDSSFVNTFVEDLINLAPGTYIYNASDSLDCNVMDSVVINAIPVITIISQITQPTCGLNNGKIDIAAVGGTAPYTYVWTPLMSGTSFNSLAPGTYSVVVTDANGCVGSFSTTLVNTGTSPIVTLTTINASCGNANGSITASVIGNPTFQYLWSNGGTTATIANLVANTYSVTVTDINGCTVSDSAAIISASSPINIIYDKGQNVGCFGDSTGQIATSVTGGTAPYVYSWSHGAFGPSVTGLPAGTYILTVTDANGCYASQPFTITQATALTATVLGDTILCAGSIDSIMITAAGGTPLFKDGIPYYYGEGIHAIKPGMNTFVVTDKNGCSITINWFVQTAPLPVINYTATVNCGGLNNATVTTTVTSGTPAYNYVWAHGPTTPNLTGLSAGKYFIAVTDANGCVTETKVEVNESPAIVITGTLTDAFCVPANSGAVNITVNGGTPNFIFNWSNSATTEDLTNVTPGNYVVTVTDSLGCVSAPISFTVIDGCACPANFSASICGPTEICQGENFTLTSQIMPRAQGYPYTYLWTRTPGTLTTPLSTQANLVQNGLLDGIYHYTLTVNFGPNCIASATYQVIVHVRPTINVTNAITNTNVLVTQMSGCDVVLNATGGTYYNWSRGVIAFSTHGSQLMDNNTTLVAPMTIQSRIYTVVGVDQFGCSNAITIPLRLRNLTITRSYSTAPAGILSSVMGNIVPTYNNATYTWTGPGNYSSSSSIAKNFTRVDTLANLIGTYTATVIQNGCQQQVQFLLTATGMVLKTSIKDVLYADENEGKNVLNNVDLAEAITDKKLSELIASEELLPLAITLFPNPTSGMLKISGNAPYMAYTTAKVFDINGKLLLDFNLGDKKTLDETIDVAELQSGSYLIQIFSGGNKSNILKFIKH